jgi:hypothetical protein
MDKACGGDGCGGSCGTCDAGDLCNTQGTCYTPNQCTPSCASKECGDDGCGGSCGTCTTGDICNAQGTCYTPNQCTPSCAGKECGDDGCGGSCGTCSGDDSCNQISGLCTAPVGLVWSDSIQSGGGVYGFDQLGTEHPIGQTVTPSDANGANLSRVADPLGGPGYALRHYGVFDEDGARSQLGLYSFIPSRQAFKDLALSGEPVFVAQEIYFPEAVEAGGEEWAVWLSILDWHTTKDGTERWDTAPGLMLKQDGSMRFQFAWGVRARQINGDTSQWSTIGMPVGEWFDLEMRWQFASSQTATVSVWINGELALEQTGVQTAAPGNNVAEFYVKLYGGSMQGHAPWSPVAITKYLRNVRISGERIWR